MKNNRFQGWRMVRPKRYWTVKQWKKVRKVHEKHVGDKTYYLDMQEVLCKKFDIILTDYRTKKEIAMGIIKAVNFKNFDKGMKVFDDAMKEFDKAMQDFGKELGSSKVTHQKITGKRLQVSKKLDIWGSQKQSKTKQIDIWSSPKPKKRTKKKSKKSTKSRDSDNLSMIWGRKK